MFKCEENERKKEEKMNSPSPNKIHSNTINNILNWDSRRLNGN